MLVDIPSILVTDDDSGFRETIRGVLEPRGYKVVTAADGTEALKIVSQEPVHLLLLDMHMPRLSGLETMRRVREFKSQLPWVLLSAALDPCTIQQARLAEAFAVLAKPVTRSEITNTVDQVFRNVYGWPKLA